jgi:2-dehydro-3-deoxygalactonokinase
MASGVTNTPAQFYIAGDWGTSSLRLWLVDSRSGKVEASLQGEGISRIPAGQAGATFMQLAGPWIKKHQPQQVLLCGMVGSNIGWIDSGYQACPIALLAKAQPLMPVTDPSLPAHLQISIVPGLRCQRDGDVPDVMRGEETQLIGALATTAALCQGPQLLCLPGTHNKWVHLQDGVLSSFMTSLSGELYDLLASHSVLLRGSPADAAFDIGAFTAGVSRSQQGLDLLHLLFETRSRQIMGNLAPAAAGSFLSGLIIGNDMAGAMRPYKDSPATMPAITVIASTKLSELYCLAGQQQGFACNALDGSNLALAGLHYLHQHSAPTNQNNL